MADSIIENPILNSPWEPDRHFRFDDGGITNEIVSSRRSSIYFIPIAKSKRKGKTVSFDTEWTGNRIEENKTVFGRIRDRVGMWRKGGYVSITPTTRRLLEYCGTTRNATGSCFSARSRRWKPLFTSPKLPKNTATLGLKMNLREANDGSNPGLIVLLPKWRPAAVKPLSWLC